MNQQIHVEVEGGTEPPRRSGGSFLMLIPGLFFLGLGVLVIVVPEALAIMVSILFFLIGMGLLVGGMSVRRMKRRFTMFDQDFTSR